MTAVLLPTSPLSEKQLRLLHSDRKISRRTLLKYRRKVKAYIAMIDMISASDYTVLAPYGYTDNQ
jgi:site-specific recombinase XerC